MSEEIFLTILQKMLILTLELSAPILLICLVVGIVISVFQAVTQIQEATLTFVPKILAGILAIILLAPWMLQVYTNSMTELFTNLPNYIR